MAHGAPDHVRMGDVNLLDYVDNLAYEGVHNFDPDEEYNILDVTGVGCLGLTRFRALSFQISCEVWVDGVRILYELISRYNSHYGCIGGRVSDQFGFSIWDMVHGYYGLWIDYHYQMSFKKTAVIMLKNHSVGIESVQLINVNYKMKV